MQAVRAAGVMTSAQVQAVGGAAWFVTRMAGGDGVTTDPTPATHTATVYVYQVRRQVATANGPVWVAVDAWKFAAPAGEDLAVEDRLVSVAMPALAYRVSTLDTPAGYLAGDVERIGVVAP